MKNNTTIGIGVLALAGVGYYFYNKSKSPMPNVSNTTLNNELNTIAPSNTSDKYNQQEATAKALVTVKDWIKIYDGLSADVLNEKSSSQIRYQKKLAELKKIPIPSREDVAEISFLESTLLVNKETLKDKIKRLKDFEYQKVYNILKDLYAQYPKADVNKLMVIMPKFLSGYMLGDDYNYSYDVFAKFSIDDKLFLSDINLYDKWKIIYQEKYPIQVSTIGLVATRGIFK